jgi:hypothetical protein
MLVFLDIDGVMVPAKGHRAPDLLMDGFAAFSTNASHVLDSIIGEFNATIMLTTSHKSNYSLHEWETIFKTRGIQAKKIKSLPVNLNHLSRKEEISSWFNVNTINEDFVIIDDDKSLNDLPNYLKDHLILTSSYVGLTENHLDEIRNIFNGNGKFRP